MFYFQIVLQIMQFIYQHLVGLQVLLDFLKYSGVRNNYVGILFNFIYLVDLVAVRATAENEVLSLIPGSSSVIRFFHQEFHNSSQKV